MGVPPSPSPLQGFRFAFSIEQDHPHPVLATLLKEALLREDVLIVETGSDVRVEGTVLCNGYADVYFRADLAAILEGQTLLTVTEKPPHGDRQENLAREIVARLKAELEKRERRGALRELGL